MTRFILFLILCTIAGPVSGQVLWQRTEAGMTKEQLLAAYPEAVASGDGETLAGGAKELLHIPSIEIAAAKFRVRFYFLQDKLDQVTLEEMTTGSFARKVSTFESISDVLRAKYGKEISEKRSRDLLISAERTWLSGRTNISALLLGIGNEPATFNINYQVRLTKDADKM